LSISQHERAKRNDPIQRCYGIIYGHLLVIVPNKSFTNDVVLYNPWNTKWSGILPSSLLLFGNLYLSNCKAHIPLFYRVSPPLLPNCHFCQITFHYFTVFHLHFCQIATFAESHSTILPCFTSTFAKFWESTLPNSQVNRSMSTHPSW
jgi:hypothetical protein